MSHFEWNATEYHENSYPQHKTAMELLAKYPFEGNENILDVGCGDGKITQYIAQQVPQGRVLGADLSNNMIDFAKKKYGSQNNLSFTLKDVQELDFDQQFDLIVSFFCLHWALNKQLAFNNLFKSLKNHRKLLLAVSARNQFIPEIRNKLMTEEKWQQYFVDYFDPTIYITDDYYKTYLKNAGFLVESYSAEPFVAEFSDQESLLRFMKPVSPHLNRLPTEDKKEEFMHEVLGRYLEFVPQREDGMFTITHVYTQIVAEKNIT